LEAQDFIVSFDKGATGKGGSVILFAAAASNAVPQMPEEGTDYFLGTDNKAHFDKGKTLPPGASRPAATPTRPAEPAQPAQPQTPAREVPEQNDTTAPTEEPNSYGFIWPIENLTADKVSARFGVNDRVHTSHKHRGIDIAVPNGTPVRAIADGVVFKTAEINDDGRGYYVYIDHGNGIRAVYQHNSKNLVVKGDHINQGDHIALVGDTGSATGPHLHLELMFGVGDTYENPRIPYDEAGPAKEHVNPVDYLPKL
jgi:murein DD-endopeptidase MepM/ murein hydrolase activator NlpD